MRMLILAVLIAGAAVLSIWTLYDIIRKRGGFSYQDGIAVLSVLITIIGVIIAWPAPTGTSSESTNALVASLPALESTRKPTISKPTNTVAIFLSSPTSTPQPTSTSTFTPVPPTPKILPHTPTPTSALHSTEVVIQSTQKRNQTGLYIDSGQLVTIEWVEGSWRAGPLPDWPFYGPSGDPQTPSKETFPVRDKPIMSLVAGIGNSQPFWVGPEIQFESTASGELWLGANDDNFTDNDGSLTITITIGD